MAAEGAGTPVPDGAIFADTGCEPQAVYVHLAWLKSVLPFPVHHVTAGNLREQIGAERPFGKFLKVDIPAFVAVDGQRAGMLNRSCTRDFKIDPIRKQLRAMLALTHRRSPKTPIVTQWIGISVDEARRVRPSRDAWIANRYPLIEADMTRADCLRWLASRWYPKPPKSSCIGCPFHSDDQWRALTQEEMDDAISVDRSLLDRPQARYRKKGQLFLHRSCVPLENVDFSAKDKPQLNLFALECTGNCGT